MRNPSSDRPRPGRIPLSRQPPIWLMIAVVVASLVPLAVHLQAPGSAIAASASDRVAPPIAATTTVHVPTGLRGVERAVERRAEPIVVADVAQAADEPCPAEPCDGTPERAGPTRHAAPSTSPPARQRMTRPEPLTKATSACREGDKKTARSTYRAIPLGDSRRREIRKACRREGVWIL